MKIQGGTRPALLLSLLVALAGAGPAVAADEGRWGQSAESPDTKQELKEMPVLTGEDWQTMDHDARIAFLLGMGHVVTIEERMVRRHPELAREGFAAKLGEGLRGLPMDSIIDQVDTYYRNNPDDRDLPVMRVIWSKIVKPKLTTGIAGRPLTNQGQGR